MDNKDDLTLPEEVPFNLPMEPVAQNAPPAQMAPVTPENPLIPASVPAPTPTPVPTPAPVPTPMPNFTVPPEIPEQKPGKKESFSILGISVVIVSVVIIIGLAFLFYYYATKNYKAPVSATPTTTTTTEKPVVETKPAFTTTVVAFEVPSVLPTEQKNGNCLSKSLATGRTDAYRCTVGTIAYDPCFATSQKNVVFCQMNPTVATSFLIKTTKALPVIAQPASLAENSVWFVKLKDGTICSPFTGTQPTINGMTGVYGCKAATKNQQILLGSLTKGQVWTAQQSVAEKQGTKWVEKSSTKAEIDTVWQ